MDGLHAFGLIIFLTYLSVPCWGQTCYRGNQDIVFVVDSSGSIRDTNPNNGSWDNYDLLKTFMQNLVENLRVGRQFTRIGLVRFSTYSKNTFFLNTHSTQDEVLSAIRDMEYGGGRTNTQAGLKMMRTEQFVAKAGDRMSAENVCIVITDGQSTVDTNNTIPEANRARADGILMYAVGITDMVNEEELKAIGSNGHWTSVDFTTLGNLLFQLTNITCLSNVNKATCPRFSCDKMDDCYMSGPFILICPCSYDWVSKYCYNSIPSKNNESSEFIPSEGNNLYKYGDCIKITHNPEKEGPQVELVCPAYGPASGGTNVFIWGKRFHKGLSGRRRRRQATEVEVKFGDNVCTVLTSNDTYILCETSRCGNDTHQPAGRLDLHLTSGTIKATEKEIFDCRPDPIITDIYPLESFVDGGIIMTVVGDHFDSVSKAIMEVTMVYTADLGTTNTLFTTICDYQNKEMIHCATPKITLPEGFKTKRSVHGQYAQVFDNSKVQDQIEHRRIHLPRFERKTRSSTHDEQVPDIEVDLAVDEIEEIHRTRQKRYDGKHKLSRLKRQVEEFYNDKEIVNKKDVLEFYIGFKLDGVEKYRSMSKVRPDLGILRVYRNPDVYDFEESGRIRGFNPGFPDNHDFLDIMGDRLDNGCQAHDWQVYVGKARCEVSVLARNVLTCHPPLDEPESDRSTSRQGALLVDVRVGNLRFIPGYLQYQSGFDVPTVRIIVIGVVVGFILLLLLILLVICCIRKNRQFQERLHLKGIAELKKSIEGVISKDTNIFDSIEDDLEARIRKCIIDEKLMEIGIVAGQFGLVYTGWLLDAPYDGKRTTHIAIKTIRDPNPSVADTTAFLEEAIILSGFQHPNILTLVGIAIMNNMPYVITPYMENGDLRKYLKNTGKSFTGLDLVMLSREVAEGMAYLGDMKFVHRDLAARNCMVDEHDNVKIADFGLSRDIYESEYYRTGDKEKPLPVKWMALESLDSGIYSTATDVWSYGILLWEIFTRGVQPYIGISNLHIRKHLRSGQRLYKPDHCTDEVYDIMRSCWDEDPSRRPSFRSISQELSTIMQPTDKTEVAGSVLRQAQFSNPGYLDGLNNKKDNGKPRQDSYLHPTPQATLPRDQPRAESYLHPTPQNTLPRNNDEDQEGYIPHHPPSPMPPSMAKFNNSYLEPEARESADMALYSNSKVSTFQ